MIEIRQGDCQAVLKTLPDASVQMCVTSPPFFGLRSYLPAGHADKGLEIGLESSVDAYVAKLVEVFREVRRVLKDDGTLWLNLSDSYSAGMANIPDLLECEIESGVLFYGGTDPRRCSAERIHILFYDKRSPDHIFQPFLTAERVSIKDGENNLCEIGGILDAPVSCWVGCSIGFAVPYNTDTKGFMNIPEYVGVIITTGDLHTDTTIRSALAVTIKNGKATLPIEITREPITEGIPSGVPAFDSFTFDASTECGSQINTVDDPVALLDSAKFNPRDSSNFVVREAGNQEFSLLLHSGAELRFCGVGHLFLIDDGLTPYCSILDKAIRKWNTQRAKQELGIPDLVKRALMEDGWICRQTIVWHKPNTMPESVKDRCTKSHEYIFLLSKSPRYYFDHGAIKEPAAKGAAGSEFHSGKTAIHQLGRANHAERIEDGKRSRRSVWSVATTPLKSAHFATFPPKLIEPCILAGSRPGDVVLDPFFGAGTVGVVCKSLGRNCIGIELNPAYIEIAERRIRGHQVVESQSEVA